MIARGSCPWSSHLSKAGHGCQGVCKPRTESEEVSHEQLTLFCWMSQGKLPRPKLFGMVELWYLQGKNLHPCCRPQRHMGGRPTWVSLWAVSCALWGGVAPQKLPGWFFGVSPVDGWELCFEKQGVFAAISSLPSAVLWDKLNLINLLLSREHLCYKLIRQVVKYHKHLCPH